MSMNTGSPLHITHAAAMLQVDEEDLPDGLVSRLNLIDGLIKRAKPGGGLRSSQIVASVVLLWKLNNGVSPEDIELMKNE